MDNPQVENKKKGVRGQEGEQVQIQSPVHVPVNIPPFIILTVSTP